MIEHSSKEGDLILDPFCGSGTICVGAKGLGRRWIGAELEAGWVGVAKERVKNGS